MKKTIAVLTVAALLIGGAMAALAQTDESESDVSAETAVPHRVPLLQEVLDDLVTDGTISQEQADTIVSTLETRREQARVTMEAHRQMMDEFWADGVLTADEIAQLPEDHPFLAEDGPIAQYLDDGELTRDELRELGPRPGFGGHDRPGGSGFGSFGHSHGGPSA